MRQAPNAGIAQPFQFRSFGPAGALAAGALLSLLACGDNAAAPGSADVPAVTACASAAVKPLATAGWSAEFKGWLDANGFAHVAGNQGWGGGTSCATPGAHDPIILLHGNSNGADPSQAFATFRSFLLANGYGPCDLYAITWIEQNPITSVNHHRGAYAKLIRDFIAAVRGYTGKAKVDVIAWSMGVTMGRKAILGGTAYQDPNRSASTACDLGPSQASAVDTFIGVAGVNRGLTMCAGASTAACSANGFQVDSAFLVDLNGGASGSSTPAALASRVYSMVLPDDEFICGDDPRGLGPFACEVAGVHTSHIPGEAFSKAYDVPNASYDALDTNYHCVDSNGDGRLNCDHVLVFVDPTTLGMLVRLVRDNDTGI